MTDSKMEDIKLDLQNLKKRIEDAIEEVIVADSNDRLDGTTTADAKRTALKSVLEGVDKYIFDNRQGVKAQEILTVEDLQNAINELTQKAMDAQGRLAAKGITVESETVKTVTELSKLDDKTKSEEGRTADAQGRFGDIESRYKAAKALAKEAAEYDKYQNAKGTSGQTGMDQIEDLEDKAGSIIADYRNNAITKKYIEQGKFSKLESFHDGITTANRNNKDSTIHKQWKEFVIALKGIDSGKLSGLNLPAGVRVKDLEEDLSKMTTLSNKALKNLIESAESTLSKVTVQDVAKPTISIEDIKKDYALLEFAEPIKNPDGTETPLLEAFTKALEVGDTKTARKIIDENLSTSENKAKFKRFEDSTHQASYKKAADHFRNVEKLYEQYSRSLEADDWKKTEVKKLDLKALGIESFDLDEDIIGLNLGDDNAVKAKVESIYGSAGFDINEAEKRVIETHKKDLPRNIWPFSQIKAFFGGETKRQRAITNYVKDGIEKSMTNAVTTAQTENAAADRYNSPRQTAREEFGRLDADELKKFREREKEIIIQNRGKKSAEQATREAREAEGREEEK